jgi:DNA mismatch repair protein MutS
MKVKDPGRAPVSILFPPGRGAGPDDRPSEPACFHDLALDQVIASVTDGFDEYDLVPLFHQPLASVEETSFRRDVFHDLERPLSSTPPAG